MTGWKTDTVIIAVGVITVCYTLIGGIEAVIWADVIQGFVLWLGILICLAYLLFLPAGGPGAIFQAALASHKITLGSTAADFRKPTILVLAIYGFFYYLQRYTADQTIVQRYLVAKSDRAALRGIALGSLLCIPVWSLFMLIGTLSWAFYRTTGERLPAHVVKADQVFPYFITAHIPPGLAGLFLLAFFVERAGPAAAWAGIVASLAFTTWATLRPAQFRLHTYMIGVIGHAIVFLVGWATSLWVPVPSSSFSSVESPSPNLSRRAES